MKGGTSLGFWVAEKCLQRMGTIGPDLTDNFMTHYFYNLPSLFINIDDDDFIKHSIEVCYAKSPYY